MPISPTTPWGKVNQRGSYPSEAAPGSAGLATQKLPAAQDYVQACLEGRLDLGRHDLIGLRKKKTKCRFKYKGYSNVKNNTNANSNLT